MRYDRLDTTKIASMGYSMGSLATFTIANDPRLTTTVHISGGNMDPSRIANLRALKSHFVGPQCTLCQDTSWERVQQKNL